MSARKARVKSKKSTSGNGGSGDGIRDISHFVQTYNHLLDQLYPAFALWDAVLYITRWNNYLLTLVTILVLTFLFYFPAVLFALLTLTAILVMALGRYHGQTKARLELSKPPPAELLDQHQHLLNKLHSEQEQMHKSRIEFKQILSKAEMFMHSAERALEYMYSIYLWKSPEVSLCITVLLCLVLVLLCTFDLHNIGAAIPAIVLCTNRHFFSRSLDLWKLLVTGVQHRLEQRRRRNRERRVQPQLSSAGRSGSHDEPERGEEEEEEEEEKESDETEYRSAVPHSHLPEEQDSSNETASGVDHSGTPELRHRATLGASAESAAGVADTVSLGEGGVEGDGWVPVNPGGAIESPQPTKRDGKILQHELCSRCQTSFFLKRKHDCSVCGQTFCSSCTIKVKKAVLGVTSFPAAETSVRVCLNCKTNLDDIPATQHT